jgi:hypothetical protein
MDSKEKIETEYPVKGEFEEQSDATFSMPSRLNFALSISHRSPLIKPRPLV